MRRPRLRVARVLPIVSNETFTAVIVGFLVSVASSFLFGTIATRDLAFVLLVVITLLFAFYVQGVASVTRWLVTISVGQRGDQSEPRDVVTGEIAKSLLRYGVLRSEGDVAAFTDLAGRATYLRGQNLLNLLYRGFGEAKVSAWFVNDHPFAPFSQALQVADGTEVRAVNALPDEMYDPAQLMARIELAASGIEYRLLEDVDIHMSLILFDGRSALIWGTPEDHDVCNFAEALVTDDGELVELLSEAYLAIEALAKRSEARRQSTASDTLATALRLRTSGTTPGAVATSDWSAGLDR